eukprot:220666_1
MQGMFFEPSGYFDDKLKRRDRKKALSNSKRQLHISTSVHSTPTGHKAKALRHSAGSKSVSNLLSARTTSPIYQSHSSQTSLSNPYTNHKNHRKYRTPSKSLKPSTPPVTSMPDDVFEAYKKKLKRKKANRSQSMNSHGVQALLSIEKKRITKDKFSRLFHDFESTKTMIDKSERDQLFRSKLRTLNEHKRKNKAIAYELINQYFTSILDRKYSNHPLACLISKFSNLFHGQYSFSPEDFKNKSIYQIIDQKRMKRKGNTRTTNDIFDDNSHKNQSKVVRKTSRRLDRAIHDVKNFIKKLRALILTLYLELKALKQYKYVVQSVFHKELFVQLTPTLGDLYSIKTEDKQKEFAKYMGMWQNLKCEDFGASSMFIDFCLVPSLRPPLLNEDSAQTHELEEEKHVSETVNKQCLTEELLKEFDANYAISQLLHDTEDVLHGETNINFEIPEYVNGYTTDMDVDDESFMDVASIASSINSSPESSPMKMKQTLSKSSGTSRTKMSSIFSAFSSKKRSKMERSHSVEYSKELSNRYEVVKVNTMHKQPSFKDNIGNITKQMLAGSHAEKIANQLHHINEDTTAQDAEDNPYLDAMLEIKKMPQFNTPEDKIQCVVRTADIIRECIDKYYENRRVEPIQITPDDLLSLFAYILTKANLHCLWAEVDLIDDFVVDNLRMDMPGYYIATLRAAMQLIVNDIEKLTQTSLQKRKSSLKTTKSLH